MSTYPALFPRSPPGPTGIRADFKVVPPLVDPHSEVHVAHLHEILRDRRACLIVGAGISVSLADSEENKRLVTWKGFLDRLALTVKEMLNLPQEWYEEVASMLEVDKTKKHGVRERHYALRLDKAAEMIEHHVNTGQLGGSSDPFMRYHHLVFKILHKLRADRTAPIAHILHNLRAPIFTTNYDVLLEDATGRFTLSLEDLLKAQRTYRLRSDQHPLSEHQQYVFHLHGIFYDDPERKFVLTSREYAVTIDDFIMALKPVIVDVGSKIKTGGMAYHRSMIFIGTGGTLQDLHFTSLFASLYEHNVFLETNGFERVLHYVLLNEVEAQNVTDFEFEDSLGRSIHAHELLVPVIYGKTYNELPVFLGKVLQMLKDDDERGLQQPQFPGAPEIGRRNSIFPSSRNLTADTEDSSQISRRPSLLRRALDSQAKISNPIQSRIGMAGIIRANLSPDMCREKAQSAGSLSEDDFSPSTSPH
ncbi:hypothetical protein DFS34DRAFT_378392 [Phlyctochytrium arcticum]|nr:hypothetical protein DFS34DRAFT_378392 [Phlyctochytrium arcticum]